jgi:hypothetical protein
MEVDYGTSFTITIKVNGGRSPHFVTVTKGGSQILDINKCSGTNELTCVRTVSDTDADYGYDGTFTVTAKNRAKNNDEKTAIKDFTIKIYKDVSAKIIPSELIV